MVILHLERFEGRLARLPNSYTNYQTYSNTSTKTASECYCVLSIALLLRSIELMQQHHTVPPKGASDGFPDRSITVGHTWSAFTPDQQTVFSPKYFERLAQASQESLAASTTNNNTNITEETPIPTEDALSNDKLDKYLPIFKELVNLSKLAQDFKDGHLVRQSGKPSTSKKVMRGEISKIVRQVSAFLSPHLIFFLPALLMRWLAGALFASVSFKF